ncbi:MAG: hypothetical protein HN509_16300 [Halobacteriovoraceae bacterium]|jgi:hypothetical protein|nr:hypothetical protein [Halobacteriovoraceae bacterium]MBT5095358.1 hypothetical protein [Halobacteriovoraceae bacterium]
MSNREELVHDLNNQIVRLKSIVKIMSVEKDPKFVEDGDKTVEDIRQIWEELKGQG